MSDVVTHTQLVFLVDVNKNNYKSSSSDTTCSQKYVNTICLSVLRLLVHFASETEGLLSNKISKSKSKQSSLKWGFKFFNSSHHYSRVGGHILRDFKLRYFEEFENEIERKFEETFNEHKSEKAHIASDCLRKALMEVIYDFQWEKPDITSPVKRRKSMVNRDDVGNNSNNLVFLFSKFPENPTALRKFAGKKVIDADVCLDLFMPESLYREFHGLYQLQLFWIDCYDILTRPGIDPKSLKLFEETLNKIGGHLIPAEILVQLCDKYVTNIASFFPTEASDQSTISLDQEDLSSKHEKCVTVLGKDKELCKSGTTKKASHIFRPVLPFLPIVYNLLNYCQNARHRSRTSSGGEESGCQVPLLSQNGQAFCELEVVPMYSNRRTDLQQNESPQAFVDTNLMEVNVGDDNVLSLEVDILRKPLLVRGGAESLRVCAVFLTQTWTQLDWTGQEQCVCTATGDDKVQSDSFKHLLSRLQQERSCLLLEVKGHAALVILKPLTTVSASLSLLSVGRTLALEKSLCQKGSGDIDTEVRALQEKDGPSWPELVTRLTEKQRLSKTRTEADQGGACFDPTVVGKAYLPGCHQSFGQLLDKLNQRISQMNFLSQDEKKTLGELQQLYRYENQPPHTRSQSKPGLPNQDLTKDKISAAHEEGKKGQGSMPSRGEMMVTRSRQAVTQKGKDDQDSVSQDSRSKDKPKADNLLSKADFIDEGELMTYLQDVYTGAVCSGRPSLSVCGQTIVTVALHYIKERQTPKPQERCVKMLEGAIILPLTGLRDKYNNSSTDVEKQQKVREYQLQVLLRLECESMLSAGEMSEVSEADGRVDQVVNLLRTLGFVTDPAALSEFMSSTLVDLYLHTLPHVLGNIYDELMQPLPSVLEDILSPNHSADQSVFSSSLLKSDNPGSNQSTDSMLSLPPSNQSDVLLNRPKRNTRRHTLVHHPSLAEVGPKRQIMVKKAEKKKDKQSHKKSHHSKRKTKDPGSGEKVCRNLFENRKTKLERRQSVAVMENIGKSRHHHSKRLPNLKSPKALKSPFKSPTFRNKKVSETPAHKQKCQAVFSRIEKERHRSRSVTTVQVVEESPVKACFEPTDSPSQRKRAMTMLRRSFYSAGPTKRSRNLVKYFQLADRMAGRPPVNRLSSGASLHDLSAEFRSPDKNSSLIFSQLIGSPTPPKSTPSKMVVTPAKHLLESPSMHTRSRSPACLEGTPRKHIVGKSLLESPCMNTRSKSPGFSLGLPKVLFGDVSSSFPVVAQDQPGVVLKETPVKNDSLVAESPSQNTRSKAMATPKRSSRAKMFLFKSPENKPSSLKSICTNISSSKCLNLSKFESVERQNDQKDENTSKSETGSVINLSWIEASGAIGGICIKDPTAQSTPRQEDKPHTKSSLEKTPSPRKPVGGVMTPSSLDKRSRRQKLQNLFQSPKSCKNKQSPPSSFEMQNVRQSPRLSSRLLSQSPTTSQGKSPRSRLSHRFSRCEKLLTSPRSFPAGENINSVHHSPYKSSTQSEEDGAFVSGKTNSRMESATMKSPTQAPEPMDTDNESIFSELSQGFDTKTAALSDLSSPFTRKRSLRLSPEISNVFSPSKRRRVQLHNLDNNKNSSVSYCLHSRILSGRVDSFGSGSSQTSQGFRTETCLSQKSQATLSQSSVDSNDYFSLSNDEVFLCRKPKLDEETSRSDSPVFGSAKKDKHRSIVYNVKPIVEDDLSASAGLVSQNSTIVSPHVTRTRQPYSTSPNVTGSSVSVSPRIARSDICKSPYVARKGPTQPGTALTKLSPSNRKYSPNVSAKSLMHLINSPLVTSPDSEEQSPQFHSLNVKRRRTHGKSKRSLDLHK